MDCAYWLGRMLRGLLIVIPLALLAVAVALLVAG